MTPGKVYGLGLSLLVAGGSSIAAAAPNRSLSDIQLKQLVQDHSGKAEAALRKAGLRQVLPRLVRLQRRTPKYQELSFHLAFTLAYFGEDYQRNVRRLIALDELWDRGDPRWRGYVRDQSDMRDEIPGLVYELYQHNHNPALLRTLFSWGLDGGAAEVLAGDHVQLLTEYPLQVLRVLRHSPTSEDSAIGSLSDGVGADETEYRRAIRSIQRASRRADPSLRRYLHRFLRRAGARWKISQKEKDLRGADLSQMKGLSGMQLDGLDLRGADLRGSALEDTDLRGSNLPGAHLRGARYNRRTRWPKGFDPRRHGAVLVR